MRLRTAVKGAVVGSVAAAWLLVASAAFAGSGVGGVFNLGVANAVDAVTSLAGTASGTMLRVNNSSTAGSAAQLVSRGSAEALGVTNYGTGPAARFHVRSGPPFTVNSAKRVSGLNADKVDGLHANSLTRFSSVGFVFPPYPDEFGSFVSTPLTTTQTQTIVDVRAAFYVYVLPQDPSSFPCQVVFTLADESGRSEHGFGVMTQNAPPDANVFTPIALEDNWVVPKGTHTFSILTYHSVGRCAVGIGRGTLNAEAMPFDGEGRPPIPPAPAAHMRTGLPRVTPR